MKKFILLVSCIVIAFFAYRWMIYHTGFFVDWHPNDTPSTLMRVDEESIYMKKDDTFELFEMRGVNMGVGIPGKWATDFAIDKETYLRWFQMIQEMGANTIRIYTIQSSDFYEAFYEYNVNREEPLYLVHGVWLNDYVLNSHYDGFDEKFQTTLIQDCKNVVDIIHGKKKLSLGRGIGSGSYLYDISDWVVGYIVGVEWEDLTVVYTDEKYPKRNHYQGEYMYTTSNASAFEAMLAEVGDKMIAYESKKYKEQRLIAFSNWPTTDPFDYPEDITRFFMKCGKVDVEHIQTTDQFMAGQFASYHVYPYYPDYLYYFDDQSDFFKNEQGQVNTYKTYLQMLNDHHHMPVVISEFGVSTGRGMAQKEQTLGRNQGNMSEKQQGEALISMYEDIRSTHSAGCFVFSWQDEWFKRTWNTMYAIDLHKTPYWSDIQTNEQYFGLLAFDPGKEESVSYIDGDISEWSEQDQVIQLDSMSLSMKYDERNLYFKIHKDQFDPNQDILYVPFDITPKSGSNYCKEHEIKFERDADFVLVIDGKENTRLLVQERYDVLNAMYRHEISYEDAFVNPPDKDSSSFNPIYLMLQTATPLITGDENAKAEIYETGKLHYGNGNPLASDFDSLADFKFSEDEIEIRLPWQLLNFANPSEMMIHDDYYENYGIDYLHIDEIYVGLGMKEERIMMEPFALKGWEKNVTYHERLKQSYYMLQDYWLK